MMNDSTNPPRDDAAAAAADASDTIPAGSAPAGRRLAADTHGNAKTRSGKEEPKTFLGRLWKNWIKPIGIAALLVFGFRSTFADWNDVPSASMEPTLQVGDRVFVNKLAYDLKVPFTKWRLASWGEPQRGDIVIWFRPDDGTRMVKRIMAVPGDRIAVRDNIVTINGEPLTYEPIPDSVAATYDITVSGPHTYQYETINGVRHPVMHVAAVPSDPQFRAILAHASNFNLDEVVPDDSYFVMGDNRHHSNDSRMFPFIYAPRHEIVGKVTGIAFSLDRPDSFAPRWHRFFIGVD